MLDEWEGEVEADDGRGYESSSSSFRCQRILSLGEGTGLLYSLEVFSER